uniref:hypothetical protein n=1 Tax=uncultured Phenylobacterium sp. TaxID=349273 RepID=UPI0025E4819C
DWTDVRQTGGALVEWRVACGESTGDSVIAADGIAKVVIALMRSWDPGPDAAAVGTIVGQSTGAKPAPPKVAKPKAPAGAKAP